MEKYTNSLKTKLVLFILGIYGIISSFYLLLAYYVSTICCI